MEIIETKLSGCYEIIPKVLNDNRGSFIKTFNHDIYTKMSLNTMWAEDFYSVSDINVIRGMHCQLPPYDHIKLVYCVCGSVLDVVIDLRPDSPTYKQYEKIELSSVKANMLYIPKGFAHGFKALQSNTIMLYKVSTAYNQDYDSGVHWDSCGINWDLSDEPIISRRDTGFVSLDEFRYYDYVKK